MRLSVTKTADKMALIFPGNSKEGSKSFLDNKSERRCFPKMVGKRIHEFLNVFASDYIRKSGSESTFMSKLEIFLEQLLYLESFHHVTEMQIEIPLKTLLEGSNFKKDVVMMGIVDRIEIKKKTICIREVKSHTDRTTILTRTNSVYQTQIYAFMIHKLIEISKRDNPCKVLFPCVKNRSRYAETFEKINTSLQKVFSGLTSVTCQIDHVNQTLAARCVKLRTDTLPCETERLYLRLVSFKNKLETACQEMVLSSLKTDTTAPVR